MAQKDPSEIIEIYIFKSKKLYGVIKDTDLYIYDEKQKEVLSNEKWPVLLELLPEGGDLAIMRQRYQLSDDKYLFQHLVNPIGEYSFSTSKMYIDGDKSLSDINTVDFQIPNVIDAKIDINPAEIYPPAKSNAQEREKEFERQKLSLGGFQHKLQVRFIEGKMIADYADFILKPVSKENNRNGNLCGVNEHLHVSLMKDFGFDVPYNGLVYDEQHKEYHFVIKRFDVDEHGKKLPQITVQALIEGNPEFSDIKGKFDGNLERVCKRLVDIDVPLKERENFIAYAFANALLHNDDFHRQNMSFVLRDGELRLSPAYDVLNTAAIRGYNRDMEQSCLSVHKKRKNLKFKDFSECIEILQLNEDEVFNRFREILKTYATTYTEKLRSLQSLEHLDADEYRLFVSQHMPSFRKNCVYYKKELKELNVILPTQKENVDYRLRFLEWYDHQNESEGLKEFKEQEVDKIFRVTSSLKVIVQDLLGALRLNDSYLKKKLYEKDINIENLFENVFLSSEFTDKTNTEAIRVYAKKMPVFEFSNNFIELCDSFFVEQDGIDESVVYSMLSKVKNESDFETLLADSSLLIDKLLDVDLLNHFEFFRLIDDFNHMIRDFDGIDKKDFFELIEQHAKDSSKVEQLECMKSVFSCYELTKHFNQLKDQKDIMKILRPIVESQSLEQKLRDLKDIQGSEDYDLSRLKEVVSTRPRRYRGF